MERDEWLRATSRVTVAREITPERLVFVDEMGKHLSSPALRLVVTKG
jgi:hypothetical protein